MNLAFNAHQWLIYRKTKPKSFSPIFKLTVTKHR